MDKSLYAYLVDLGCCKLCCLRFLGERKADAFRNVDDTLKKAGFSDDDESENPRKIKKSNICLACLGLLQESQRDTVIKQIISEVNKADYDCKEFTCALSMPVSFSLRDHSLSLHLKERGEFLTDAPHFISVKDVWKWVAPSHIAKGIGKAFSVSGDCDFSVVINIGYGDDEKECACLLAMHADIYEKRRKEKRKYKSDEIYTRKSVEAMLLSTSPEHFKQFYTTPPGIPTIPVNCVSVSLQHSSVFVAGRYNKYSRTLSQTPWVIDGQRHMEHSVQEYLCDPIVEATQAQDMRFSSSGREDVDVRMLGRGRPFVCELINPRRVNITSQVFRAIEKKINSSTKDVAVRYLQIVSKDEVAKCKLGEEEKTKIYRAYCVVFGPKPQVNWDKLKSLSQACPIVLHQKTPIRVLHRRSLATRERSIHSIEFSPAETEECRAFVMRVATQAGTYVKEFVHGDFGRTSPNLRDLLGVDVDILALDVEDIVLDWPKAVDYEDDVNGHEVQ